MDSARTRGRLAGLAVLAALWATAAAAQIPDHPYVAGRGQITVAGEVSATTSLPDGLAYFNYTDYAHDGLRTFRARLLAEWRPAAHLAVLGEVRAENHDSLEAAALYVRWRPWVHRTFDIQVGRIPPVIGVFARRAYGHDNLTIGTPLAYQYLTSLRPDALPATMDDLLRMRARGWRPSFPIGSQAVAPGLPIVAAFRWDTGVEAHWARGRLDLSGAITRGAPAVPVVRETNDGLGWSGRAALTPVPGLTLGVSAARGNWINRAVLAVLPVSGRQDAAQSLVGADLEFGRAQWLVRAEWLRSAFHTPIIGAPQPADPLVAASGFVEGRWRWHPRWQTSGRFERLTFSDVRGTLNGGLATPWDAPVTRIEAVLGFRASRNLDIRAGWQENWRDAGRVTVRGYPTLQVLYWF